MNLLVTGAAGYIGSRVVGHFVCRNRVLAQDRLDYGVEALLPFFGRSNFSLQVGDLNTLARMTHPSVDVVIHCAALVGEAACQARREDALASNVEATKALVEHTSCPIVYLSTCSVYESGGDTMLDERSPITIDSLYAETKLQAEEAVLKSGRGIVLRLGTVVGTSARMRFDTLANGFARDVALGRQLVVVGPDDWRPYLTMYDLVRVLDVVVPATRESKWLGRIYNVVSDNLRKAALASLVLGFSSQTSVPAIVKPSSKPRSYCATSAALLLSFGGLVGHTTLLSELGSVVIATRYMTDPNAKRYANVE